MAEEAHLLRGIHWREAFPFTNIFRAFRVAIHPSKLILALLALLSLYVGGRVLDGVWRARDLAVVVPAGGEEGGAGAVEARRMPAGEFTEIEAYERYQRGGPRGDEARSFSEVRAKMREQVEAVYAREFLTARLNDRDPLVADEKKAADVARGAGMTGAVKDRLVDERGERVEASDDALGLFKAQRGEWQKAADAAEKARDDELKKADDLKDANAKQDARAAAETKFKAALEKAAADARQGFLNAAAKERDDALEASKKMTDEASRKEAAARAQHRYQFEEQVAGQFAARKTPDEAARDAEAARDQGLRQAYDESTARYQRALTVKGQGIFGQFFNYEAFQINGVVDGVVAGNWLGGFHGGAGRAGVLQSATNFFTVGPMWMMQHHTVYFILFVLLFLFVWALFGGAISRIAAVHVARDEKISIRQALRFSAGKFLSFIFAPIIPLMIVLVVGLVVSLGGLFGNIPVIGPILVGLLFFLALGAGFVMTLVLLGTAGGFNLMYPTIAVEGSDSFDAISRSFSYVYARPWRMLFYTIVAVVYGALTYEFVHLFVQLMLTLTHHFVGTGMFAHARNTAPLWDTMWSHSPSRLSYDIDFAALRWDQAAGAGLVAFWVYLVAVAMVGAFAISFYFSVNTITYYLMRREVDATEMDDVYLEQADEDFAETAPAAPPSGPAPLAPPNSTPAASPPPANTPATLTTSGMTTPTPSTFSASTPAASTVPASAGSGSIESNPTLAPPANAAGDPTNAGVAAHAASHAASDLPPLVVPTAALPAGETHAPLAHDHPPTAPEPARDRGGEPAPPPGTQGS